MKKVVFIVIMGLSNACSIMPIKDFKTSERSSYKNFSQLTNKFVAIYPNERFEAEGIPPYGDYVSLPLKFKNCKIELYHEVTHYRTGMADGFLNGLSVASLGIIPYDAELSFKTRATLASNKESVSKEISSEKIDIRFGLIYIPMFVAGIFNSDVHLTNNITAKMYAQQVSKLAEELKDFKCD